MSIRSTQKAQLKTILESITYNGSPLAVFDKVKLSHTQLPYVFITSGAMSPNKPKQAITLHDTSTYLREYYYFINLVTQAQSDESLINIVELQLDDLEEAILDKLQLDATRDNLNWQDLVCTDISTPFSGAELNLADSYIVKTFTVAIEKSRARV